jgi:hypothetical protein
MPLVQYLVDPTIVLNEDAKEAEKMLEQVPPSIPRIKSGQW